LLPLRNRALSALAVTILLGDEILGHHLPSLD
jgi:hypothetical protein